MTSNPDSKESPIKENELLSTKEQATLSQLAATEPPHSQRAQALLAIDSGATHAEASHLSRLTIGQVRYWLAKFRREGTGIFPEELIVQPAQAEADLSQGPLQQAAAPDVPDLEQPIDKDGIQPEAQEAKELDAPVDSGLAPQAETSKVKKKSTKTKKSKKTKKSQKVKKTSKGKKSGKKSNQDKKRVKKKRSGKKTKKKRSKKAKGKKGKSAKKKRKK